MIEALLLVSLVQSPEARARHRNVGKAYYERGEYALAVEELEKVLELESARGRDYFNAAMAYLQNQQVDQALAAFTTARQMEPGLVEVDFGLGVLYKRALRYPLALESLQRVAARDPGDPCTWFNIGAVSFSMDRIEEAEEAFLQVLDMGHARAQNFYVSALFRYASLLARRGSTDEAQRLFAEFEALRATTPNVALTPTALENGRYGRVESYPSPSPPARAPADAVDLTPVGEILATACGLDPVLVPGDYDSDGKLDVFAASPCGRSQLFRNLGGGRFEDVGLEGLRANRGALFLDYENSGLASLYVFGDEGHFLYRNRGGLFEEVGRSTGLSVVPAPESALALDFDNDSQVDLALATNDRVRILRNDGDGSFTASVSLDVDGVRGIAASDFDEDGFVDLFVPTAKGARALMNEGGSGLRSSPVSSRGGASLALVADFDGDGWIDVVASGESGSELLLNRRGRLEALATTPEVVVASFGFEFLGTGEILSYRGERRFETRPLRPSDAISGAAVAGDLDGDGRLTILHGGRDGRIRILRTNGDEDARFLHVALEGKRTNRQGVGAVIELKAGRFYRKAIYPGHAVTLDTDGRERLDVVRVTWPNGVIQNVLDVEAGLALRIEEEERQTSSCPFLYAWNGERFEFLTDVVGRAPLGEILPDGSVLTPNPDDYVRIPPGAMAPKDGRFVFQLTEELRELAYIDRVRLLAYDRPREVELYVDEKFSSPPFTPYRLYPVSKRMAPLSATNGRAEDVFALVRSADGESVDVAKHRISGFAEEHALVLTLPPLSEVARPQLFLTGWVYWPGSSSMRALSTQESFAPRPPRLEVRDHEGNWVTVIEDLGLPSGIDRTLVADLTGVPLGVNREVRIATNFAVYWDEAFFAEAVDRGGVSIDSWTLAAVEADLHYRGFSFVTREEGKPERYDYERLLSEAPWNATSGLYTGYGDRRALVSRRDGRMVVMAPGDELTLSFDPSDLPAVPDGFEREFVLHVTGWAKDQDPNTRFSMSVDPLPESSLDDPPRTRRVPPLVTPLSSPKRSRR